MAFEAKVYQVMIASPNDVLHERHLARQIIHSWNDVNAFDKGIFLFPVGWETNSAPKMGDRPQEILNQQILEASDLLIGIFWTRLGTPTGEALSGTVEEIEKHVSAGKLAMLYFSEKPVIMESVDIEQYQALRRFKVECLDRGLVASFDTPEDFQDKLSKHLSLLINKEPYFVKKHELTTVKEAEGVRDQINDEFTFVTELSEEAKELLREVAQDPNGRAMKLSYIGGFAFQTNQKTLNSDQSPRTRAIWESAFEQLMMYGLLDERGTSGQVFALTLMGYKVADLILRTDNEKLHEEI
jgi:hypothetical protein